ncbi:MAG: Ig-like domain-containing protein [Bacteroidetes bacterium]|nr:Ig-like domain-containing protein [Bacteroidota bacterium]
MKASRLSIIPALAAFSLLSACANIVAPTGGKQDLIPPRLISLSPPDSQRNARIQKIRFGFDEYVTLSNASAQVQIAPLLRIPLTVTASGKHVSISIPDSLLQDETTYHISLGDAIRDIHEGNAYSSKGYTFSTGAYFDSLAVTGRVLAANTGLPDSAATVMLYAAASGDSAVVREKPMYSVRAGADGRFVIDGLPARPFRIYALRDANNNLTYDGGNEWIAFSDSLILPAHPARGPIELRIFQEPLSDTAKQVTGRVAGAFRPEARGSTPLLSGYRLSADTNDLKRRTQDLNDPLMLQLAHCSPIGLNKEKLFLSYDSSGITVEASLSVHTDSDRLHYELQTPWLQNTAYTLRLQKGFAQDSSHHDLMPGRYSFRTKRDEDYGRLSIHLPSKYYGKQFLLQVSNEKDTVYQQPVRDTMVVLPLLAPGMYTLRVIVDANENGAWDAGNLFLKRQPERVIPYLQAIHLKAGWEQQVDFEGKK